MSKIQYKFDILPKLKEEGWSAHRMRTEKIMGERTIQQIRNRELVSWSAIEKICGLLHCQPGDILEYVEDETDKNDTMSEGDQA